MDAASGAKVIGGRYECIALIGRGGMGEVWRARDTLLRRDVAVKRLTYTDASGDAGSTARAMREARLAARLNHPHAVAVYDVVMDDGLPCMIMELVEGTSLREYIDSRGHLDPMTTARIGRQVAAALAAAHRVGIVHRDVKPANVLIDTEGTAKLTDFGIARDDGDNGLTSTGTFIGTPSFLAPEIAQGATNVPASDVWALGAVLFAAVEGQSPFGSGGNALAILSRIASTDAPVPQHGGPVTPVIVAMMKRDPNARPAAMQVVRDLDAVLGGTQSGPAVLPGPGGGSNSSGSTRAFPPPQGAPLNTPPPPTRSLPLPPQGPPSQPPPQGPPSPGPPLQGLPPHGSQHTPPPPNRAPLPPPYGRPLPGPQQAAQQGPQHGPQQAPAFPGGSGPASGGGWGQPLRPPPTGPVPLLKRPRPGGPPSNRVAVIAVVVVVLLGLLIFGIVYALRDKGDGSIAQPTIGHSGSTVSTPTTATTPTPTSPTTPAAPTTPASPTTSSTAAPGACDDDRTDGFGPAVTYMISAAFNDLPGAQACTQPGTVPLATTQAIAGTYYNPGYDDQTGGNDTGPTAVYKFTNGAKTVTVTCTKGADGKYLVTSVVPS